MFRHELYILILCIFPKFFFWVKVAIDYQTNNSKCVIRKKNCKSIYILYLFYGGFMMKISFVMRMISGNNRIFGCKLTLISSLPEQPFFLNGKKLILPLKIVTYALTFMSLCWYYSSKSLKINTGNVQAKNSFQINKYIDRFWCSM